MTEGAEKGRVCYRCLLREVPEDVYFQKIKQYVDELDESIRADKEEYERRLAICTGCKKLRNGMCGLCGCFVEMRAAVLANYCPHSPEKW